MSSDFTKTSVRIRKVNRLIQEELGKIIHEEIELPKNTLITIISVETSVDIKHAKIMVSIVPKENTIRVLKILEKNISDIQSILNKRLVLKFVPKIRFIVDKTQDRIERIEMLLKKDKEK